MDMPIDASAPGLDSGAPHADMEGGIEAPHDATIDAGAPDGIAADVAAPDAAEAGAVVDAGADAPVYDPACQTIATDAQLTSHVRITADNECEVFVNGVSVGTTTNWGSPVTIDVSLFVYPGRENVIAVRATNTSSQSGNDRGILGELTVDGDAAPAVLVDTDHTWRVASTEQTGWTSLGFDDSAWTAAAEIAANGDPPWGSVFGASAAKWIWSAPIPVNVADKPNVETTYARRTFYFGVDGKTLADTPSCPVTATDF
jgi:hypothetical protein